jgi:hypothetical protein
MGSAQRSAFSRAAPIDRESILADFVAQNSPDLVDAQRHRLECVVSPRLLEVALSPYHVLFYAAVSGDSAPK